MTRVCAGRHHHVPDHEFQVSQGCGLSCVSKTFCHSPLSVSNGEAGSQVSSSSRD